MYLFLNFLYVVVHVVQKSLPVFSFIMFRRDPKSSVSMFFGISIEKSVVFLEEQTLKY